MLLKKKLLQDLGVEAKVMKIIYLIFAILLWSAIPIFRLFSLLGFILFIFGLILLLRSRKN